MLAVKPVKLQVCPVCVHVNTLLSVVRDRECMRDRCAHPKLACFSADLRNRFAEPWGVQPHLTCNPSNLSYIAAPPVRKRPAHSCLGHNQVKTSSDTVEKSEKKKKKSGEKSKMKEWPDDWLKKKKQMRFLQHMNHNLIQYSSIWLLLLKMEMPQLYNIIGAFKVVNSPETNG